MARFHPLNNPHLQGCENLWRHNGLAILQIFYLIWGTATRPRGSPAWGMELCRLVYQEENKVLISFPDNQLACTD